MKHIHLLTVVLTVLLLQIPALAFGQPASAAEEARLQQQFPGYRNVDADYRHAGEAALERWQDWKWGLRIHWGLYAMFDSRESWIIRDHKNDTNWLMNYYASYQRFNPTNFHADQWMEIMQRAGMKYFSFTTKHHEGFCLWPTKTLQRTYRKNADGTFELVTNHFSIAETPFRQDVVGALVKSARAHQIGVSLYYSHIDWHDWDFGWDNQFGSRNFWYDGTFTKKSDDPARWAAFIQKERDQITELLTWYGPIDTLCLDMSWLPEAQQDAYGVAKLARQLQPNILLRNRGIGSYGDYETPERQIPEDPSKVNRPWQVIYPGGKNFSYNANDTYKSREWILENLIDTVAKGGNFQIGFGPDPTGAWPTQMIERVSYVGDWLKVNGEAIYATRPYLRYHEGKDLRFTRSKDKKYLYLISLKWPSAELESKLVRAKPGSAIRLLGYNHDLKWSQSADTLIIQMPEELQDETKRPCQQACVFKIESQPWDTITTAERALPEFSSVPTRSAAH